MHSSLYAATKVRISHLKALALFRGPHMVHSVQKWWEHGLLRRSAIIGRCFGELHLGYRQLARKSQRFGAVSPSPDQSIHGYSQNTNYLRACDHEALPRNCYRATHI